MKTKIPDELAFKKFICSKFDKESIHEWIDFFEYEPIEGLSLEGIDLPSFLRDITVGKVLSKFYEEDNPLFFHFVTQVIDNNYINIECFTSGNLHEEMDEYDSDFEYAYTADYHTYLLRTKNEICIYFHCSGCSHLDVLDIRDQNFEQNIRQLSSLRDGEAEFNENSIVEFISSFYKSHR